MTQRKPTFVAFALLMAALSGGAVCAQQTQSELARETALQLSDAQLAKVFVAVRTAESAGDVAMLDAIDACRNDALTKARVAFAREAIRGRRAATSAKELVAFEDALASRRVALRDAAATTARQESPSITAGDDLRLAQRELLLEAAEDVLLCRLTADGSDAALAVGWLTPTAEAQLRAVLTRTRAILNDEQFTETRALRANAAAIATDPAVFRLNMLEGLAMLAQADLLPDASETRDALIREARDSIAIAAQSELALPKSLTEVLALARVRANACDSKSAQECLLLVSQSRDATLAWTARVLAWKSAAEKAIRTRGDLGAFPTLSELRADAVDTRAGSLEELAALSEVRARIFCGQSVETSVAPLTQYLQRVVGETTESSDELGRRARRIAERLPSQLRLHAQANAAPPLLIALALLESSGRISPTWFTDRTSSSLRAAAQQASRDRLIAPWFTVPYASALFNASIATENEAVSQELASEATEALLWLAAQTPPSQATRDAVTVAIDARNATVQSARADIARRTASSTAERALDAALTIAIERFPTDPLRDAWLFARVDLALFPTFEKSDLAQASKLLAQISRDARSKPFHDLRALEIEFAQLDRAQPTDIAAQALALVRRAELLDIAIRPPAPATNQTDAALSRCNALRAALALRAARPGEAMTIASRVFRKPLADCGAAERAAKIFGEALLLREAEGALDEMAFEVPSDLLAFASETNVLRETLLPAISAQRIALDALLESAQTIEQAKNTNQSIAANIAKCARRLGSLVTLALAAPTPGPAELDYAAITAATAEGIAARESERTHESESAVPRAINRARALLTRDSTDRTAKWLLAQALLVTAKTAEERAEVFALCKELAPVATASRDRIWWRAQLTQLEILSMDLTTQRATDVLARLNRLASIDPNFGDRSNAGNLSQRFAALKKDALSKVRPTQTGGKDRAGNDDVRRNDAE